MTGRITESARRTVTITVKVDRRLHYLTCLCARKQRRTVSSFAHWALGESLKHVRLDDSGRKKRGPSAADEAELLWQLDERERFAALAMHHPTLLTFSEESLWKMVRPFFSESATDADMQWLREHWETLTAVAEGAQDESELPAHRLMKIKG